MFWTPESATQSCDIGQRIPYFDTCQLTITWVSNIKLIKHIVYERIVNIVGELEENVKGFSF